MLDIHLHPAGTARRLTNDPEGLTALIAWLREFPIARIDAVMLARLGAVLEPKVRPIVSQGIDDLRELHVARMALVKDRVATINRSHSLRLPLRKRHPQRHLKQIAGQLAAIDAAIQRTNRLRSCSGSRLDILLSIPGVGRLTAFAILVENPELGSIENKAAASLAGLAPVARDPGRKQGKRFIQGGGRPAPRHALYMPAIVAARFACVFRRIPAGIPTQTSR